MSSKVDGSKSGNKFFTTISNEKSQGEKKIQKAVEGELKIKKIQFSEPTLLSKPDARNPRKHSSLNSSSQSSDPEPKEVNKSKELEVKAKRSSSIGGGLLRKDKDDPKGLLRQSFQSTFLPFSIVSEEEGSALTQVASQVNEKLLPSQPETRNPPPIKKTRLSFSYISESIKLNKVSETLKFIREIKFTNQPIANGVAWEAEITNQMTILVNKFYKPITGLGVRKQENSKEGGAESQVELPTASQILDHLLLDGLKLLRFTPRLTEIVAANRNSFSKEFFERLTTLVDASELLALYNEVKDKKREQKTIIREIIGGKVNLEYLNDLCSQVRKRQWQDRIQGLIDKKIRDLLLAQLPKILKTEEISSERGEHACVTHFTEIIKQQLMKGSIEREDITRQIIDYNRKQGLTFFAIPQRISETREQLSFLSKLEEIMETKNVAAFLQAYDILSQPWQEVVLYLIGGKQGRAVLQWLRSSLEEKYINILIDQLILVETALQSLENIKIPFKEGFDFDETPFFLIDPKQILRSFSSYGGNRSIGSTVYFSFNGVPLPLPDFKGWAQEKLSLSAEETETKKEAISLSWLVHTIEYTHLKMETTPKEAFAKVSLLGKDMPQDQKLTIQSFLFENLTSYDGKFKNSSAEAKKEFILEALAERQSGSPINVPYLKLLQQELKNVNSPIFKPLNNDVGILQQAKEIVGLLHRYQLYFENIEAFPLLPFFLLFSISVYGRAQATLRTKCPKLHLSQEPGLGLITLLQPPTCFEVSFDLSQQTFQVMHRKKLALTSSTYTTTKEERQHGVLPVAFSIKGGLKGDSLYAGVLNTSQVIFNEDVFLKERVVMATQLKERLLTDAN